MKFLPLFTFLFCTLLSGQGGDDGPLPGNVLVNPSFELGKARHSLTPDRWLDCGGVNESPVDVHANDRSVNTFGVRELAAFGEQFVGMAVRDNGTIECISQRFRAPLPPGEYTIRITAARPREMDNISRRTGQPTRFTEPVLLEMVGRLKGAPSKYVVLAQTPPVRSHDWTTWDFTIRTKYPLRQFNLSAQYAREGAYNGYVLVDRVELARTGD